MKIIRSDARYQLHNEGMRIILEFRVKIVAQRNKFWALRTHLTVLYGPNMDSYNTEKEEFNTQWRYVQNLPRNRARLFLKDEAMLSYVLLSLPAVDSKFI